MCGPANVVLPSEEEISRSTKVHLMPRPYLATDFDYRATAAERAERADQPGL